MVRGAGAFCAKTVAAENIATKGNHAKRKWYFSGQLILNYSDERWRSVAGGKKEKKPAVRESGESALPIIPGVGRPMI